jgi:predicted nucleic acid-binding protein
MVLVDTSIWVDHFNHKNDKLEILLFEDQVVIHPYIIGELSCGNFKNRNLIISLLKALPKVSLISIDEFYMFIEKHKLYGIGLGYVDIHFLASAYISNCSIYTRDKSLSSAANQLGIEYK